MQVTGSTKSIAEQRREQLGNCDNPVVRNALTKMSDEDLEGFLKFGEYMYNTVDHQNNEILKNAPPPTADAIRYIHEGLRAGLLPTDMEARERQLMEDTYGPKWYESYGFTEEDLPDLTEQEKKALENFAREKLGIKTPINDQARRAQDQRLKLRNKLVKQKDDDVTLADVEETTV